MAHGLLHDLLHGLLAHPGGSRVDGLGAAGDDRVDSAVAVCVIKHGWALSQFALAVGGESEV